MSPAEVSRRTLMIAMENCARGANVVELAIQWREIDFYLYDL
jgi:hypothetical protein